MTQKKAAHENPLIPNARLKQMYRAILRAHLLGQALPPAQRALTAAREAALVSTSIDLTPRDLVLDAFSSPVVDFLRGAPLHHLKLPSGRVPHPSSASVGSRAARRIFADCGSALRMHASSDAALRVSFATGAAAALKSTPVLVKRDATQSASSAHDLAIVVAFALPGQISADTWKSSLAFAAEHDLPVIFVVLPHTATKPPRKSISADLRAIAHRAHVPAIPVDAADPVALYRVAQESIGHARIGGGPALIECISFPTPASRKSAALSHLEQYILQRGIAAQSWFDREARAFSTQIRSILTTSK